MLVVSQLEHLPMLEWDASDAIPLLEHDLRLVDIAELVHQIDLGQCAIESDHHLVANIWDLPRCHLPGAVTVY